MGWAGVVVAHVILVPALGPNPFISFFGGLLFNLGVCWDRGLDLDQGLTIIQALHLTNDNDAFSFELNTKYKYL